MGGSSKQTVGYKYFAGLQVVIGSCIEQILNINPDNRGWINSPTQLDILKQGDTTIYFNEPDLFGGDKQEGGWVGYVDIHTGRPEYLRQNEYLAAQDSEFVSAFPYLSYLVFRGNSLDKGFQLVSMSGMLKEVLYWPKRTQIKDDGSEQWYKVRSSDNAIVCEIGEFKTVNTSGTPSDLIPNFNYTFQGFSSEYTYSKAEGVFRNAASSAYGGVENPEFEESIYFKPIADEIDQFDLIEITASVFGSVREIYIELLQAGSVFLYEIERTGGEEEEKSIAIKIVCNKGSGFPYLKIRGVGTIPFGGTNYYSWQFTSKTIAIDYYEYFDNCVALISAN